ncbi:putative sporulation protein YtxC [Paenibacillus sp. TRM 82003]|nr:putative sporulation protein YtxC [Paenibacillus sp. TRM 82003]
MELFTLLVNPAEIDAETVTNDIRDALRSVHTITDHVELRRVPLVGGTGIVCDISPEDAEGADAARKKVARALAGRLIEAYEGSLIDRCIRKEVERNDPETLEAVRAHCKQLLTPQPDEDGEDAFLERRIGKLAGGIEAYLSEEPFVHVEGFLRFRSDAYLEELRDTVAYAVDECMMERQYQEFISLLKYFVYIQEAKIPAAHVVHHGNHDFTLYDESMRPIDTKQMDQFVVELIDKDINYEDVIVSTLISVCPGKLFVHTQCAEQQVIKTIMTIFEGRAELCTECSLCQPLLEERKRK